MSNRNYNCRCLNQMLTIVSALSVKMEIFYGALYNLKGIREMKVEFNPLSDHISVANIYNKWQDNYLKDPSSSWKFCKKHSLQFDRMNFLNSKFFFLNLYYYTSLKYKIIYLYIIRNIFNNIYRGT
jgi:hypothetical protein